jgi:hypothetical protein
VASREELLAQKKALEAKIAKGQKVDVTTTTASQRIKYMDAVKGYRKQLAEVNNQLAGKPKTPPKSDTPYTPPKSPLAPNAPANVPADVMQEMLNSGVPVSNSGTWQSQGVGMTSMVWLGDKGSTGKLQIDPTTGKPVPSSGVLSDIKYAPTLANSWWTDAALQKKVIDAYAAKGQTLNLTDGFAVWQGLVNTAATIYNGGRGAKMTPFDLLSDALKNVKSVGRQTSVDTAVRKYSDAEVTALINQNLRSIMPRDAKPEEIQAWAPELKKKLESGSVTKSIPVGTTGTKTFTNPGFTEADITSFIRGKVAGTQDYIENKSQGFMDFISRNR